MTPPLPYPAPLTNSASPPDPAPPLGALDTVPVHDGARTRRLARCPDCWLPVPSCVCAELPRIHTTTRVVIVMHHTETRRTSNTGRLAARVLGAPILLRGLDHDDPRKRGPTPDSLSPGARRLVLFPAPTARVLSPTDALDGPLTLVVPDGSWRQASRTLHRDEAVIGAEPVTLPPGPRSRYKLRRRPAEHSLCTYEAIARALAILDRPDIEPEMMRALDLFVARTLVLRGGIPAAGFD